jgi:hypothetical protein
MRLRNVKNTLKSHTCLEYNIPAAREAVLASPPVSNVPQ